MNNLRTCDYCGSVWVCWGWVYTSKDRHNELNSWDIVDYDSWIHECWDCNNCYETHEEVKNGIKYEVLRHFHEKIDKLPCPDCEDCIARFVCWTS